MDHTLHFVILQQEAIMSMFGINQMKGTLGNMLCKELLFRQGVEHIAVDAEDESRTGDGSQRRHTSASTPAHVMCIHHFRQLVIRDWIKSCEKLLSLSSVIKQVSQSTAPIQSDRKHQKGALPGSPNSSVLETVPSFHLHYVRISLHRTLLNDM